MREPFLDPRSVGAISGPLPCRWGEQAIFWLFRQCDEVPRPDRTQRVAGPMGENNFLSGHVETQHFN
jgi:hypothetical protein